MIMYWKIILTAIVSENYVLGSACDHCGKDNAFLFKEKDLHHEFRYTNKILTERTGSENVNENMQIAVELYSEDLQELDDYVLTSPSEILEAEKVFLSLRSSKHDRSCKSKSFVIVNENWDAILGQLGHYDKTKLDPKSRITKLLLLILKQHANICRYEWPEKISGVLSRYDAAMVDYVSNLTG